MVWGRGARGLNGSGRNTTHTRACAHTRVVMVDSGSSSVCWAQRVSSHQSLLLRCLKFYIIQSIFFFKEENCHAGVWLKQRGDGGSGH